MNWHSNICFICLDDFTLSNPRLFFHNCIHAVCRDCLDAKIEYCDIKKKKNIKDLQCNYGHCNKPILIEALDRNMNIHKLNESDSVYVYNYSSYDIPDEAELLTKDNLQEIMIKSQGYKLPDINEKTKIEISKLRRCM